ncbi:hypothetical protein Q1695_006136 [Nippostrongylus brasiliensis]|nr:hypothetical protein Q1695_006136 [Nippostrongylus brasiliensis]
MIADQWSYFEINVCDCHTVRAFCKVPSRFSVNTADNLMNSLKARRINGSQSSSGCGLICDFQQTTQKYAHRFVYADLTISNTASVPPKAAADVSGAFNSRTRTLSYMFAYPEQADKTSLSKTTVLQLVEKFDSY